MSSRRRRGRALGVLAAIALVLLPAGSAFAHGEEGEALAKTPARTLVQQALGLLTQANDPLEAHERLEAALESEERKRVQIPAVRDAMRALDRGDHEEAREHINEALAPVEDPTEAAEGAHAEQAPAEQAPAEEAPADEALAHTEEFEPDPGTEEWVGLAIGVVLIIVALGLLATRRRTVAA